MNEIERNHTEREKKNKKKRHWICFFCNNAAGLIKFAFVKYRKYLSV